MYNTDPQCAKTPQETYRITDPYRYKVKELKKHQCTKQSQKRIAHTRNMLPNSKCSFQDWKPKKTDPYRYKLK